MNRQTEIEALLKVVLEDLGVTDREALENTPKRWAKWLMEFAPNEQSIDLKTFENPGYDEMVYDRCEFYSLCQHHMLPIVGTAHVAYISDGRLVGLSKLSRAVRHVARQPQMQERMTQEILKLVERHVGTSVAVKIKAQHFCKSMRGIECQVGGMVTTAFGGKFKESSAAKREFLMYCDE